jgi:signal transduction histidine kinase/ActR/RegA family two-component response regulator
MATGNSVQASRDTRGNAGALFRRVVSRWRAVRLSTKAIWLSTALTTLVIATVFITLSIEIRLETKQILQDLLNRSEQQVVSIKEDRLSQLLWVSSQVANNPTLRAAMETFRLEPTLSVDYRSELLATLQNELDKIWAGLPSDLLIVTDDRGRVLAANGRSASVPAVGADLSVNPALSHALSPQVAVGDQNFGLLNYGDHYFLAVASPIVLQEYLIGALVLGDRIDSSFLPNLRAFFGGSTVITVGGRSIASTLPEPPDGEAGARTLARLGSAAIGPDGTARLGEQEYLVTSMVLGTDDRGQAVTLFLLRSLTEALHQPNQKLMKTLATQAALAVLLGALLAWIATRVSLRPLAQFVDFMKEVAKSGDYSRRFRQRRQPDGPQWLETAERAGAGDGGARSNNELDLLVDGFNGMLAEIEGRDSSLKKAHKELEAGIRELNRKEEELRQLQKMEAIGLLAGGVAHDFNNILMVVSGCSDMALKSLGQHNDQEARELIEEIQKASKSASLLTRQLLAFSSKQVTSPKIINITRLIRERKDILRRVVGDSIVLTLSLEDNLDRVLADPAQIEQVLLNLIVNGRDAIDSTGTIRIETRNVHPQENPAEKYDLQLSSPHVLLAVTDSGCGMEDETLEHIFEPFFTTKDKGKGTGLGLSTVHGIVKQYGGHIRVESKPGSGSIFRVFFPAITEATEETEEAARYGSVRGSATILLVEDEADVRKVVKRMLAAGGYTVLEADGPRQALTLFEQKGDRIDLLLTDVTMPEMNGSELSARIAQLKPGLKTLFMSGFAADVIGGSGILPEGVNVLEKPFAPDALTARIARILTEEQHT